MSIRFPRWYTTGLALLAVFYIGAGINHFLHPAFYLAIMPPYIPHPLAMIYISGAAEILGGIGVRVGQAGERLSILRVS